METPALQQLIQTLSRLPGLGPRSGRRVALHLLKHRHQILDPLVTVLSQVRDRVTTCGVCGCLGEEDPCAICVDPGRDPGTICVVADMADVWALERAGCYQGTYHVLGGTLSGVQGVGPENLTCASLVQRCGKGDVRELIFALSATVEGQTTAHYVMHQLKAFPQIRLSTLARGIPLGGELDYLDEGTLATALETRRVTESERLTA